MTPFPTPSAPRCSADASFEPRNGVNKRVVSDQFPPSRGGGLSLETIGRYCMTLSALGACALIGWELAGATFAGSGVEGHAEWNKPEVVKTAVMAERGRTPREPGSESGIAGIKPGLPANTLSDLNLRGPSAVLRQLGGIKAEEAPYSRKRVCGGSIFTVREPVASRNVFAPVRPGGESLSAAKLIGSCKTGAEAQFESLH